MSVSRYTIELDWKEFNLSLPTIHAWMQANAGDQFCGISGNSKLQLHFIEEPTQEDKDAIAAYWESLDEESDEAADYQTAEQIKASADAAKATALASATSKLEALGLSADEIAALKG